MTDTSTTLDHLIAAVLARPEDDLPRLVMADRLDEEGEPERAEFIRIGVEIPKAARLTLGHDDRMGCMCGDCLRYEDLEKRERELIEWFCREDFAVFFGLPNHEQIHPVESGVIAPGLGVELIFSRGLIAEVRAPLAMLIGGECEAIGRYHHDRCNGGRIETPNPAFTIDCPACSGTGRTRGILRDVLKCQPVTKIVISGLTEAERDGGAISRVEILPPGKGYGWQAYIHYGRDGEDELIRSGETRDEMIDGLISDLSE